MSGTHCSHRTQGPFRFRGRLIVNPDEAVVCAVVSDNPGDDCFVLAAMNARHRARPLACGRPPLPAGEEEPAR